jgi:hypothetical protein
LTCECSRRSRETTSQREHLSWGEFSKEGESTRLIASRSQYLVA